MPDNRLTLTLDAKNLASKEVKAMERSLESASKSLIITGTNAKRMAENSQILSESQMRASRNVEAFAKSGKALSESQAVATRQMQAFAQAGNVASQSQMQATRQMEAYQKAGGLTIPIQNQLIGNVKNTVAALQQKASSLKAVTTRLTEYNTVPSKPLKGSRCLPPVPNRTNER